MIIILIIIIINSIPKYNNNHRPTSDFSCRYLNSKEVRHGRSNVDSHQSSKIIIIIIIIITIIIMIIIIIIITIIIVCYSCY